MESGIAVTNQSWMVPSAKGFVRWWLSSKTLVSIVDDSIAGVAGVMHEISGTAAIHSFFSRIEPALKLQFKLVSTTLVIWVRDFLATKESHQWYIV